MWAALLVYPLPWAQAHTEGVLQQINYRVLFVKQASLERKLLRRAPLEHRLPAGHLWETVEGAEVSARLERAAFQRCELDSSLGFCTQHKLVPGTESFFGFCFLLC